MTWILANYYKDEETEWEKLQLLCRFINPVAAKEVFDKDVMDPITEVSDDEFLREINAHASEKIEHETLQNAFKGSLVSNQDLDVIVPAEE